MIKVRVPNLKKGHHDHDRGVIFGGESFLFLTEIKIKPSLFLIWVAFFEYVSEDFYDFGESFFANQSRYFLFLWVHFKDFRRYFQR